MNQNQIDELLTGTFIATMLVLSTVLIGSVCNAFVLSVSVVLLIGLKEEKISKF